MRPWIAALLFAGSVVAGCGSGAAAPTPKPEPPAVVEAIEGGKLHRITLTPRAAERLGIETAQVVGAAGSTGGTRVPYSAIIYAADGAAWTYVEDGGPNVYVRHAVAVEKVVSDAGGDYAVIRDGPAVGRTVVSVGVAELYGTEFDVGH